MGIIDREDFALGADERGPSGGARGRQLQDVFALQGRCRGGDVIREETGVKTGEAGAAGAAILTGSGLEEREERLAVGGERQSFEALVVLAADRRVEGRGSGLVGCRIIGGERISPGALRDESGRRADRGLQDAGGGELINVGTVFVADVQGAIGQTYDALGVEREAAVEALGQHGQGTGRAAQAGGAGGGVESGERGAVGLGEEGRVSDGDTDLILGQRAER